MGDELRGTWVRDEHGWSKLPDSEAETLWWQSPDDAIVATETFTKGQGRRFTACSTRSADAVTGASSTTWDSSEHGVDDYPLIVGADASVPGTLLAPSRPGT